MTVSIKRWIAVIAMIAMTLAGTPIQAVANDGLNSSRYGFKPQQNKTSFAEVRASLSQNPFRGNSVTATIVGNAVRVEKAEQVAASYAKIIRSQINFDQNAKALLAERANGVLVTPNFGSEYQINLYEFVTGFSEQLSTTVLASIEQGLNTLQLPSEQAAAVSTVGSQQKSGVKISTASFRLPSKSADASDFKASKHRDSFCSFSSMTMLKSDVIEDASVESVKTNQFSKTIKMIAQRFGAGNTQIATLPAIEAESGLDIFSAVHPAIQSIVNIDLIDALNTAFEKLDEAAVEADLFDDDQDSESLDSKLLLDSFIPNTNESESIKSNPSKLSVPAMMIGSTTVKHQPIGFARKVSSAFNTAKILVKSVINVVGPVAGIDQAFEYSRKWHAPMFRWDGLNWCTWSI